MSDLIRFGISVKKDLLERFDKRIKEKDYTSRSKAIIDLIREDIVDEDWGAGKEVVGTINLVFDHHKREISSKLTDIQHNFHQLIISSQHVHLDHHDCLEIIVVKGSPKKVQDLANKLKAVKAVKYASLNVTTSGSRI